MKSGIPKIALLAIALNLSGCRTIEDAPEYWQCQFNGNPRAFYCKNSRSGQRLLVDVNDTSMKGAQCVSADDYRALENYKAYLIDQAQRRCN